MVDKKTVMKVAELARLHVSESEATELEQQFATILGHFAKIQNLNTEHIEPMLTPMSNPGFLRPDDVCQELTVTELLKNAPETQGHLFKVPPVV